MGTDKEDTDPSSPGALRPRVPDFAGTASAFDSESDGDGGDKPTTDPGLGPTGSAPVSSQRSATASHRPRRASVSVPPPSLRHSSSSSAITPPELTPIAAPLSATAAKDSVELLLEGMAGPRPDRRKTMPQSDGEAAAAYHAEHGVRRARTSSEPGPKVVVERPQGSFPTERKRALAAPPAARAPAGSREALSTFVPARALRRRVALAVVAGLLIVLLSFMTLRLTGKRRDALAPRTTAAATTESPGEGTASAAPPSAATPEATAASPDPAREEPSTAASPQAAAVPVPPPSPVASVTPSAPTTPGSRAASPARSGVGSGTIRHHHGSTDHLADHPPSEAPSATGADLGEFKAKF